TSPSRSVWGKKTRPGRGGLRPRGLVVLALGDARRLAAAATQIIELRAADPALAHDGHGVDQRRINRENALHTFAIGDLADGEALVEAFTLAGDAHAFERLDALARLHLLGLLVIGLLDDLDVDLQRVAGAEFGMGLGADGLHLLGFELFEQVHGEVSVRPKFTRKPGRIAYRFDFS